MINNERKRIKLRINTPMRGQLAGSIITVTTDRYGKIVDSFWSRRLKDAEKDKCIEIVSSSQTTNSQTPKKEEERKTHGGKKR